MKQSLLNVLPGELDSGDGSDEDEGSVGDDNDGWEKVSYEDLKMDGMADPFANGIKKMARDYRELSDFAVKYDSWTLKSLIVKANDDVRQEVLALQLMSRLQEIFSGVDDLPIFLRPYEIFVTSRDSGLIELVPDTISLDSLKKKFPSPEWDLGTFFRKYFAEKDGLEAAQKCFAESLAGYSIFTYLFNVKDRHNGNILLDPQGHIIHIDFGFFLQNSPGGVGFEAAPFKFTTEYLTVLGGVKSPMFKYFKRLMVRGLSLIKKRQEELYTLITVMSVVHQPSQDGSKREKTTAGANYYHAYPCFRNPDTLVKEIRDRLISPRAKPGQSDMQRLVDDLITASLQNPATVLYDQFQKLTNHIAV